MTATYKHNMLLENIFVHGYYKETTTEKEKFPLRL